MNKNTGMLSGGGVEKVKVSGMAKSAKPLLNYKVVMVVRDNGYSLKITDFYYNQTSRKYGNKTKMYVCENPSLSKKTQAVYKRLKKEASMIAQNVKDEVRKELYKNGNGDIANSEASAENVHW